MDPESFQLLTTARGLKTSLLVRFLGYPGTICRLSRQPPRIAYQRTRLSAPACRRGGASRVARSDARATTVPRGAGFSPVRQQRCVWTSSARASARPAHTSCCQRPSSNGRWKRCCGAAVSSTTRACKSAQRRGNSVASRCALPGNRHTCRPLRAIKAVRPEYNDIHAQVLQDVLHRLDNAFAACFRRVTAGE